MRSGTERRTPCSPTKFSCRPSWTTAAGDLVFVGPEVAFDFQYASIGVRENDGELKSRLNAAIGAMRDDGTLNDLIRKWFGEDAETF